MKIRFANLLVSVVFLLGFWSSAWAENTKVKVGVLKFGTVNWELAALKNAGLDAANGIDLEIVKFAGDDATNIALQGGAVDIIVSDWLWVSRQRSNDTALTLARYSSSVGSLMVREESDVKSLADVRGLKIGVAGGPLDKSWLLLQGMAKQEHDLDLVAENEIVFGSPPLLAEKTKQGEIDANLNYWHYCARLEAAGFRVLTSAEEAANALGATGPLASIGYVFNEEWANDNKDAVAGFLNASRATKELLNESDAEWDRLAESGVIKDKGEALEILRDRFRQGIPTRELNDEIRDAEVIYRVLAKAGGTKLVGDSAVLVDGTFWEGAGAE